MSAIDELERTILALPVKQRVRLAESLLGSLPPIAEPWSAGDELAEVERREKAIEGGEVQPISEIEFWKRIENQLRRS